MLGRKLWPWIALGAIALCVGADYCLRYRIILPSFLEPEREEARKDVLRCLDAVHREIHHLSQKSGDWAVWDDTYRFVQDGNAAYVASNMEAETLEASGINLLYICDLSGGVVWGGCHDSNRGGTLNLQEFPQDSLGSTHYLVHHASPDNILEGLILTSEGPMLISSRPILTSAGAGPPRGTLIMGRFLDAETLRTLSSQIKVPFTIQAIGDRETREANQELLDRLTKESYWVSERTESLLDAYGLLRDIRGDPALLVKATIPREIMARGRQAARYISIAVLGAASVLGISLVVGIGFYVGESHRRTSRIEALVGERTLQLQESEERFRTISAYAQDAILMTGPDGGISFWNAAAEKIFGRTCEEALGQDFCVLLAPGEDNVAWQDGSRPSRLAEQRGPTDRIFELNALRKDGREFPAEASFAKVKMKDGWHVVAVIRDITQHREVEDTLRQAKQAAEEAARAKSEFVANMSHEIRTPMNGIIGMAGLLLDTDLTAEQHEFVETIAMSSDALLAIVNDILDFSRIEAGKMDLEELDFDLRTTIEEMNDILAVCPQEKGLEYTCLIHPNVPSLLRGDPGRLRQVLTNLIGNAVKFTAEGEVALEVGLETESDGEATVRFEVKDTGIGIPRDKIEKLFAPFTQADASTTRQYGGTGLGLSISKRLAEQMGGRIGAQSEAGKGSTFWFTVTLRKQEPGAAETRSWPEDAVSVLVGKRILVVDDNATSRAVLKRQLESWRCECSEASDGETAMESLRAAESRGNPFQIALLDMQLPNMDGETLGRTIREDASLADTLLVMMTSMGRRGDATRLEQLGFAAYLTKPVKQSQLHDCLVAVVDVGRATGERRPARLVTRHSVAERKRRGLRILLAEDNPTNRVVALAILKKLGYRADAVANGLEVLRALETIPYDLVLMDFQMPEMDGFEATGKIRDPGSKVLDRSIPVIAMTAHAMKGDREKCLESGMNDYVAKPVKPLELAEAIERHSPAAKESAGRPSSAKDSMSGTPFSRDTLLDRLDGDRELVEEVLSVFLEDTPRKMEELREAVDGSNLDQAMRLAHSLKGAAGNIGATRMHDLARQAEAAASEGNLAAVAPLTDAIRDEFGLLREAIGRTSTDFGPPPPPKA